MPGGSRVLRSAALCCALLRSAALCCALLPLYVPPRRSFQASARARAHALSSASNCRGAAQIGRRAEDGSSSGHEVSSTLVARVGVTSGSAPGREVRDGSRGRHASERAANVFGFRGGGRSYLDGPRTEARVAMKYPRPSSPGSELLQGPRGPRGPRRLEGTTHVGASGKGALLASCGRYLLGTAASSATTGRWSERPASSTRAPRRSRPRL